MGILADDDLAAGSGLPAQQPDDVTAPGGYMQAGVACGNIHFGEQLPRKAEQLQLII